MAKQHRHLKLVSDTCADTGLVEDPFLLDLELNSYTVDDIRDLDVPAMLYFATPLGFMFDNLVWGVNNEMWSISVVSDAMPVVTVALGDYDPHEVDDLPLMSTAAYGFEPRYVQRVSYQNPLGLEATWERTDDTRGCWTFRLPDLSDRVTANAVAAVCPVAAEHLCDAYAALARDLCDPAPPIPVGSPLAQVLDRHGVPLDSVEVFTEGERFTICDELDMVVEAASDGNMVGAEEDGLQWQHFDSGTWFVYSGWSIVSTTLVVGVCDGFEDDPDTLESIDEALSWVLEQGCVQTGLL